MPEPRYDLLAIDLDGTLLDATARVSRANIEALARAREAGIGTVICTGRGLVECAPILQEISQCDPVVVAGGSILACPLTRATLHRFPMDPVLVRDVVGVLLAHGHAAMILKDHHVAGYDYLVVCDDLGKVDPVSRWWFDNLGVEVRFAGCLEEDEHPEHTVRVGVCGTRGATAAAARELAESLGTRTVLHHFPAVAPAAHAARDGPVVILEAFDRLVSKWTAIRWYAQQRGVAESRIAAIGDEINDVPMIRHAALGIAMGNAVPEVRGVARRTTLDNASDGVAHAVDRILTGEW
ncbi:MAG TPA: HAD family hydrolase [Phycisphaerales bacterium]|nr:HAD family hydrolase [Phycisphaerales bacterium]